MYTISMASLLLKKNSVTGRPENDWCKTKHVIIYVLVTIYTLIQWVKKQNKNCVESQFLLWYH